MSASRTQRRESQDLQRAQKAAAAMTAKAAELVLVRHGETAWNREHRLQGQQQPGPPLNQLGWKQCELLRGVLQQRFAHFDAVVSSDLLRTVQTAQVLAGAYNLQVQQHPGLRERNLGLLQGLTYAEAPQAQPDAWAALQSSSSSTRIPGGGESLDDLQLRMAGALLDIAAQYPGKRVLLASPGADGNTQPEADNNGTTVPSPSTSKGSSLSSSSCHAEQAAAPWSRLHGAKRIQAELRQLCKDLPSCYPFVRSVTTVDDRLHAWRLELCNFDDGTEGGRQLNEDLRKLGQLHGLDHLLLELEFPDDYPTRPFFARVVKPRCVMYTGHVTAGGSICLESLTNSGSPGCWQPSFCVGSILHVIVNNMLHAEVMDIETPTGPGGRTGPLRVEFDLGSPTYGYSSGEARAAFDRTLRNHKAKGWGHPGTPGNRSTAPALAKARRPGMMFSTSGGPGSTLSPGISIQGASQHQQPTSPGLAALAAGSAASAGTTGLEAFGQTTSTQQQQALGSRAASYQLTHTIDTSSISTGPCQVFMCSITAMGAYQHMSAEELRWADYEAGFSGGIAAAPTLPAPAAAQSRFDAGALRADHAGRPPFPAPVHDENSNSAGTGGGFFGVQTAAAAASGSASSAGTGAGFGFGALPAAAHGSASSAGTGAGFGFGALPAAAHGSVSSAGTKAGFGFGAVPAAAHGSASSAGTKAGSSFGALPAATATHGSASSAGTGAGFGFGALPAATHRSASSAGTGAGSSFGALPAATAAFGSAGSAGFSFGMPSAGLSGRGAAAALVPPAPGAAQPRTL
ncbi:hypothetical protein OEZ86_014139 [Tetradesmus obliquus]|nr:hypothetical protein OEZ86_014139 [Tetradesmus obliquus]